MPIIKKLIISTLSIASVFMISFCFLPKVARADSPVLKQIRAGTLEQGEVASSPDEYLNSSDQGFAVSFELDEKMTAYSMGLFIDGTQILDEAAYDGSPSYTLFSTTHSATELQATVTEGEHTLELMVKPDDTSEYQIAWDMKLIADYTSPSGIFEARPKIPEEIVGIGDTVYFKFTPNTSYDIKSVNSTIYDRNLIWEEINVTGGRNYFVASYLVAEGDSSQEVSLMLEDVKITDLAGNTTKIMLEEVFIDFKIDTDLPALILKSGNQVNDVTQGENLIIEGTSEPGSQIILTIHSDVKEYRTLADSAGDWAIIVDSSELLLGQHSLMLTAINSVGNKTVLDLGIFNLIAAMREQAVEVEDIQIAKTEDENVASDVVPQLVSFEQPSPVQDDENLVEISKEGRIGSGQTAEGSGINWSAWILVLAIVVFASALTTAGYYGYGWVVLRQEGKTKVEKIRPQEPSAPDDLEIANDDPHEEINDKNDQPPQTRW